MLKTSRPKSSFKKCIKNYKTFSLIKLMKKPLKRERDRFFLKTFVAIKFMALICCFTIVQATATAYGQLINLNLKNVSIEQALLKISQQSKHDLVYDSKVFRNTALIHFTLKEANLEHALNQLFENRGFEYEIRKNTIIVRPSSKAALQNTKSVVTSQQRQVTGKVSDSNGSPLVGVTVTIKGTSIATTTDESGNYKIAVTENAQFLTFSTVGYEPTEISIINRTIANVTLNQQIDNLEEVVVVGYGTQRKKDLTGAVANISSDKLNTQSNVNIGQAIQGKIAGVDIVSQGGAPGAGSRIMIRGIGTLNNVSPLYIVDGIYMNNMDNINPNDVESIDVLKDASSAAIYGSRAANGVIIITTKSGSNTEGEPIIDAAINAGLQTPSRYLDMMNAQEWAKVSTLARQAIGAGPLAMAADLDTKEDNDWQRTMMGTALMQNYNLTIKGGSKYFTYYTGLGYMDQDGTIQGTKYKRYNAQIKTEFKKNWLKIGNNTIFSSQKNNPLYSFARGGYLGIILQSIPTLSQYDPTNDKGGYGKVYGDATDIPNPLGILDQNLTRRTWDENKIYLNFYAEARLPLGLKYRFNVTPDFSYTRNTDYQNEFDFGLRNNSISSVLESRNTSNNLLLENLLSYDQKFGKHTINGLIGYAYQNFKSRYIMASGRGLPPGIYEVGAASQDRLNDGYSNESALTSIISRAFYSYDQRYLLTATYRRDGSSKFRKGNRYGHFPSFSVGWNMKEEAFMQSISMLNQLKLRGGYGVLGNQEISNYMYTSVVTSNINYPDGNGGVYNGAFPKDFANPNIRWEETAMTNIGVDVASFNNRLTLTADWYLKNTKDILLTVPIPISTGGANDPVVNAGRIRNKGFEFTANWSDRPSNDFGYVITLTGNFVTNRVVALGEADQIINGGANRTNVTTTRTLANYPIGGFWLIPTQGLFQTIDEVNAYNQNGSLIQPNAKPGDVKFSDTNGDGKITDDDRVYMGSPLPTTSLGLNFNANYKQFDLLVGMQGVMGNKIYNATRLELEGVNKGTNYLRSALDYWTEDNRNASAPRLVWDDPNQNNRPQSDRYLEDGSFFRVRNIQLGYTFPAHILKNKLQRLKIYTSIENPFTITGYSGYTPDIDGGGDLTSRGFDSFVYPTNRIVMFGVNLSF